ncbi:hypothetical protein B4U80_13682 [Leptotrombidium deliense]|uniref:C2 domain-containing protein n=1 Tax=Leptotrombidium deliense TaxID=299467 RepID=A0A443SLI9_9ACAR|nr:hypothetical protein B4U80_13682 [Leptotrombidium deliense]
MAIFKCVNGNCVHYYNANKEQKGVAQITIFDASVPNRDMFSKSDVYVKIRVFGPVNANVGKTATVENNNDPVFNTTFTTPEISKLSSVIFEVIDKDFRFDDFIASVFVSIDETDHKLPLKLAFPGGWIRVKLHWINRNGRNSIF